jgi:hypothetical protein
MGYGCRRVLTFAFFYTLSQVRPRALELDAPEIYARRIHAHPPQVLARGHIGRRRRGGRHGRGPPEFKPGPDVVIVARDHVGPDRRCGSNAIQIIDMFVKTMLNTVLINMKKKKKKNRRRD